MSVRLRTALDGLLLLAGLGAVICAMHTADALSAGDLGTGAAFIGAGVALVCLGLYLCRLPD